MLERLYRYVLDGTAVSCSPPAHAPVICHPKASVPRGYYLDFSLAFVVVIRHYGQSILQQHFH